MVPECHNFLISEWGSIILGKKGWGHFMGQPTLPKPLFHALFNTYITSIGWTSRYFCLLLWLWMEWKLFSSSFVVHMWFLSKTQRKPHWTLFSGPIETWSQNTLSLTKVTQTEEIIRQNTIDSILHEKNQFCFGQSHKFSTYVILNFELFKNTK